MRAFQTETGVLPVYQPMREQEVWYALDLPWWTRFGRDGTDGLTYLERKYLARQFMKKTGRRG